VSFGSWENDDLSDYTLGGAKAHHTPALGWHGADEERRRTQYIGAPTVPRTERSEVEGRPAPLDLSIAHTMHPVPVESGEWHVQETSVDGYAEFIALEDADGSLGRSPGHRETVVKSLDETVDDLDVLAARAVVAARRAKRNLKWKCLCLRADRIVTLTVRGRMPTHDEAWRLWSRFERCCYRRFKKFAYVVVIEPHKIGGFHIHFATNTYLDANALRLLWHRVLLDDPGLRAPLRGDMSPGNIDITPPRRSRKISGYLAKYLGKTFDTLNRVRVKRFASSKGIPDPIKTPSRMHARCGEHVYRLRKLAEVRGWKVEAIFEGSIAGRRLVWMQCVKPRAAARSPEGPSIRFPGAFVPGAGAAYS
jgi:hypothetical protein